MYECEEKTGTVVETSSKLPCPPEWAWVQLDGDCRVPLLPSEFKRHGIPLEVGARVIVAVGDIHPFLVGAAD